MVLQDAAGSLNPRQTVYESVAEGIRLHRRVASDAEGRTEVQLVSAALAEAGCVRRNGSSCATRTSSPVDRSSGC